MPTPRGSFADFPWRSWGAACTAVLLLLEAAKLVWMFSAGPAPLDGDAGFYWKLGEQVAAGDFWMRTNPVGFRTPGYPWFLGAVRFLFGTHAWQAVIALQHVAVGVTTALTGWWTFRLTERVALVNVAIFIRVISLANAGYAGTVLTEALFEPVFLLLLIRLTTPIEKTTVRHWGLMGVLFAAAFLFRPAVLALVPAIAVAASAITWPPTLKVFRWETGRRLGIVLMAGLLLVGPWCARNAVVFGRPVPMIFFGRELWMSVYGPGSPAGPTLPETPEAEQVRQRAAGVVDSPEWRVNWSISSGLTRSGMNDAEADALMQQVAWQGLQRNPARWVARSVWRSVDLWRTTFSRELFLYGDTDQQTGTGNDQARWGSADRRITRAAWLDACLENRLLMIELGSLLGLLGTCGLWLHPRTARAGWILAATLLGFGLMTGLLEQPNYRFRMVLEPILIIGAVTGFPVWWEIIRRGCSAIRADFDSQGTATKSPANCEKTDKMSNSRDSS